MSTRISDLPEASTVNGVDLVPIVQDGATLKATASLLVNSQLPLGSAEQPGILQLGTISGTACDGADARLSNGRPPAGDAGGDLTGTYPDPVLVDVGTPGTYGSTSAIPVLTLDSKGRVTSIETSQLVVNADNITSGTLSADRLAASGVVAQTVGSSTQIPVLGVDAKGRVTSIATSQLVVNADNITSGTISASRLPAITGDVLISQGTSVAALETTGVSAGSFGSSTQIPVLTVDAKGRITAATTSQLAVNAENITSGTLDPNRLATSGVAAGTFGSAVSVGQFTVDSKGRITSATEVGISGSAGGTVVAVGATSSTLAISNSPVIYSGALQIDLATTGVSAITAGSGTQSAVVTVDSYGRVTSLATAAIQSLSPTGVVSGSYGHPERVAQFTVNANGVLTGATEAAIAIPAAAVSGLAASATSDTTNAGNIITGTLSSDRIPVLASSQIAGISAAQVAAGITSAQISGLGASQISGSITSAQIAGIGAAQVGAGITSAQLSAITGTGAVVLASTPTIANANINAYTEGVVAVGTVTTSATLSISAGTVLTATLTASTACTFTMPAVGAGKSFVLYLKQPAVTGNGTATFTGVAWAGAATPVVTATAGRMDILSFVSDGVKWYGNIVKNYTY